MAVVATVSNHFKYQLMAKAVSILSDTFKLVFMNSSFAFDKDTHATYADISANEISAGSGYTTGGMTITLSSLTEDDTNDKATALWTQYVFTATGAVGPVGAAVVIDTTVTEKTVVMCIDFGTDYTLSNGDQLKITPKLDGS
uniref:Uncharacterized protein n=1 Tax=viral metagenome TaxID=1070528 RepID=A0A6M3JA48_9ZZZZ